jgi:hypothetical protein
VSKKSKAYQAAAELLAEVQDYPNLEGPIRDQWLQQRIQFNTPAWDIIWKAARRAEWEKCQDDVEVLQSKITQLMLEIERLQVSNERMATNQPQLVQTAKTRLERIQYLERELKYATGQLVDRNKELADALEAVKTAKSLTSGAQARGIELLRSNQTLRSQNENLKHQLVEATALTTEGTRTLQERFDKLQEKYQRGERLYEQVEKENNYNQNALTLAEEELVRLREQLAQERTSHQAELDAVKADVNYFRDKLAQVTTPVPVDPTQQRLVASLRATLKASMEKRDELLYRALEAEQKLATVPEIAFHKPEGSGWVLSWTRMTGQTITGRVTEHGDGSKTTFDYNPATGMAASTWSGTPEPKSCGATDGSRTHVCTRTPGTHRQHVCHCNHLWS